MKFYTYILKSQQADKYYIGYISDLKNRLQWHNEGKSGWSRRYKPWDLVYSQDFLQKSEAIKRERQIKRSKSKIYIKKLIADSGSLV